MSPNMKITLLALAGSAAAVPHHHLHARYHHATGSGGFAGPTGGWTNYNHTRPAPSGTGVGTGTGTGPVSDKTTTLQTTQLSTQTIVSTIYATAPKPSAVNVADLSSSSAPAVCGPPTVYVTATEKVTVTVPAGNTVSPPASPYSVFSSIALTQVLSSSTGYGGVPYSSTSSSAAGVPSQGPPPNSSKVPTTSPVLPVPAPSKPPTSAPPSSAPSKPPTSAIPSSAPPAPPSSAPPAPPSSAPPPRPTSAPPAPPSSVVPSSTPPASSATPSAKPSSVPGYSGVKRGLAYRYDGAADCKTFASKFKAGFAWNWESDPRGDIGGIPFIPTLRTLANAGDWAKNVDAAVKGGSKVVFGFNEPDKPDQANLSPPDACKAWKEHMNPIAAKHPDVQIVGPSVSSDVVANTGLDWLSQFKKQCPDAIMHAANIHWYGYNGADFDTFKKHVDDAVSKFGKVWVTEFGLVGRSEADSKAFLSKALPYLDSNPNCVGYSYFAVGQFDKSFNMLGTGNALTAVGEVYVA